MRLDRTNYRPGDVVLLDGEEISPSFLRYADEELGEVERIQCKPGSRIVDKIYVARGKVEIRRGAEEPRTWMKEFAPERKVLGRIKIDFDADQA